VIISARVLTALGSARALAPRRHCLLAACLGALVSLALIAAPAVAVVTTVGSAKVGLQPANEESLLFGALKENALNELEEEPQPTTFANASGNPVVHGSNVYAVYWDPTSHYHGDWRGIIDGFLHGVAHEPNALGNVFAVDAQYTDLSNVPAYNRVSFRGAYTDTTAYPISLCSDSHPLQVYNPHQIKPLACLTDAQLQTELQAFITANGLPRGMNTIYYLLTPPGVTVCLDAGGAKGHCSDFFHAEPAEGATVGEIEAEEELESESYKHSFCSYHSDINLGGLETGDANTLLYAVVPWTAGGIGDGQLAPRDETSNFYCQDGGFNPASKPIELHTETTAEPAPATIQEPNQVKCPSADGYCDAGLADLIVNQIAVEQQNTVTNPLLNAWQDSAGKEGTDECRNYFEPVILGSYSPLEGSGAGNLGDQQIAGGLYYINNAFNRAGLLLNYPGHGCLPGVALDPKFTSPENVNSGDVVGFDGMESNIALDAATKFAGATQQLNYATFTWSFGDGSPTVTGYAPGASDICAAPSVAPCAASVFHSYQYGGTYHVTLTATDVAGNTASVTNSITVTGPPPPGPEPTSSSGSGSGSTGSTGSTASTSPTGSTGSTGSTGTTGTVASTPVATATIVSRSLKTAARKGLAVRYSVNEQVAGRFEVLITRAMAKRLGIAGVVATGLPAGSPAQLVVAKAILITTKAGRSTVVIPFSKRTTGRLLLSRKLTLTLRLIVRNAASHNPASTTVVTAATLSH
jgi:PKD domain-containing protein